MGWRDWDIENAAKTDFDEKQRGDHGNGLKPAGGVVGRLGQSQRYTNPQVVLWGWLGKSQKYTNPQVALWGMARSKPKVNKPTGGVVGAGSVKVKSVQTRRWCCGGWLGKSQRYTNPQVVLWGMAR